LSQEFRQVETSVSRRNQASIDRALGQAAVEQERHKPGGSNRAGQNEERHPPAVIPVGLDAKRDEQNGSNRVQESEQEGCLEWSDQATPVGPTGENTNNPASQHAGKQVSRGEDGDQGGGLFCASEVLPAQVANQDEHAADANPQDGDAPGFGRGDPGRRSGKGVL